MSNTEKRGEGTKAFVKSLDSFFKKISIRIDDYDAATDPKFDQAHELSVISLRLIQIIKTYEKKNPDKKDKNEDSEVPDLEEKEGYKPTRSLVDEQAHKKT